MRTAPRQPRVKPQRHKKGGSPSRQACWRQLANAPSPVQCDRTPDRYCLASEMLLLTASLPLPRHAYLQGSDSFTDSDSEVYLTAVHYALDKGARLDEAM